MEQKDEATFEGTCKTIAASGKFETFKKEHPSAELVAGFFILDFLSNDTKKSLDYLDNEQVFTFDLADDGYIKLSQDKLIDQSNDAPKLTKLESNPKVEVNELKSIVGERKLEDGISAHLHKIIAVLQNHNGKLIWNLTCMLDQLIILHVLIDAETGEILKFERKSMMDFIKRVK